MTVVNVTDRIGAVRLADEAPLVRTSQPAAAVGLILVPVAATVIMLRVGLSAIGQTDLAVVRWIA